MSDASWAALATSAGVPSPRLFDQHERLFGAADPFLQLWHDSAAWHPFANQVWLLIESMRLPHIRRVVPLSQYRKPSDGSLIAAFEKELSAKHDAVPLVQLATGGGRARFDPPLREKSAVDLLHALHVRFPERALLPQFATRRAFADALIDRYAPLQSAMYGVLGGRASAAAQAKYARSMDEWNAAYAAPRLAGTDDGDGDELAFGGPMSGGPFLFGARPCAVDVLLLPLLERCEANVVHPIVGGLPHMPLSKWPALTELLEAARRNDVGFEAFELLSDATTTVGIRLAVTSANDPAALSHFDTPGMTDAAAQAATGGLDASRDAAARLCASHAAIARFAAGGAGTGRPRSVRRAAPTDDVVGCVDEALRATAALLLLRPPASEATCEATDAIRTLAEQAASDLVAAHGAARARVAAESLVFLGANVGVPRDMDRDAASALRAHLKVIVAAVRSAVGG